MIKTITELNTEVYELLENRHYASLKRAAFHEDFLEKVGSNPTLKEEEKGKERRTGMCASCWVQDRERLEGRFLMQRVYRISKIKS